MARKVFLSFLGAGYYKSTVYSVSEKNLEIANTLRFVQEASLLTIKDSFISTDKVYVFTTPGALKNWESGDHINPSTNEIEFHDGLKSRLQQLNLKCDLKNILIKDGKNTNEIWSIFESVYSILEEDDQLYFDITHGFRTLPMLNMVLINYAKLLKNVSVVNIFYGAFEAKLKYNNIEYTPIWDLKSFADLQDWTNGANLFLKSGNALEISKLIHDDRLQLLRSNLEKFSKDVLVNRGINIFVGETAFILNTELSNFEKSNLVPALNPIVEKVKNEFIDYKENSSTNGVLAVRWCIKNGLIQQAATLLEEFMTTFILEDIDQMEYISHSDIRTKVSGAMSIGNIENFNYQTIPEIKQSETEKSKKFREITAPFVLEWENKHIPVIFNLSYKRQLSECVNKIKSSIRNDINHAGFREDAKDFESFNNSIVKRYNEVIKILNQHKGLSLTGIL